MPSLQEVINVYLQLDRSPVTNQNYGMYLNKLAKSIGPDRDIRRIAFEDLVDYMAALRKRVAPTTYKQYHQLTRSFFAWCVKTRYLDESPAAGLTARTPRRQPQDRAISKADLDALLDALKYRVRDHAMVMFLADTGCRVGGLVSLQLSKLDLDNKTAVLHEKGDRYYTVYFTEDTVAALKKWLARRPPAHHDYVFTTMRLGVSRRILAASVGRMVARVTKEVCSRSYGPHSIRHAVGHLWAKAGVPVTYTQHKLGHTSPSTTLSFYYPESEEGLRSWSEQYSLVSPSPAPAAPAATPEQSPAKPAREGKIIRLDIS